MLGPNLLQYKKYHRGALKITPEVKSLVPVNGGFAIKTMQYGRLTRLQLFAMVKYLKRRIKKFDKFWVTVFPQTMETKKGLGSRMGKGKGLVDDFVVLLRKGRIIIEFGGFFFSYSALKRFFIACSHKSPLRLKFVRRYL